MKIPKGYSKLDIADYLKTEKDIAAFLEAVFAEPNPEHIAHALGIVARARGMTHVAKKAKMTRASLYKALSGKGNPEFSTIIKVIDALGFKLQATVR